MPESISTVIMEPLLRRTLMYIFNDLKESVFLFNRQRKYLENLEVIEGVLDADRPETISPLSEEEKVECAKLRKLSWEDQIRFAKQIFQQDRYY